MRRFTLFALASAVTAAASAGTALAQATLPGAPAYGSSTSYGSATSYSPAAAQAPAPLHAHTLAKTTPSWAASAPFSAPYSAPPTTPVAQNVRVDLDHTAILRLPQPAAAILVGNPDVADVSVHTTDTVLLVGRSYGRTNVLALDAAGRTVYEGTVQVGARDFDSRLQVFGGSARRTFDCAPRCQAAPELGDDAEFQALNRPRSQPIINSFTTAGAGGRISSFAPTGATGVGGVTGVPATGFPAPAPVISGSPTGPVGGATNGAGAQPSFGSGTDFEGTGF